MTYKDIIHNLDNGIDFSFSRFGDGEMFCMEGKEGMNCDRHKYFPDLGKALRNVLNDPKGVMALLPNGDKLRTLYDIDWADGRCFCDASIRGDLERFTDALIDKYVIVVGPLHLYELNFFNWFIQVPTRNAWLEYDRIKKELKPHNTIPVTPGNVIIYACGMMAPVLIHDLYREDITQIDVGAVFDPYCGVYSRLYHKDLKL
ncbi:hypothetical protein LCGC14_3147820 [marine sediment metagenome]|uniref:Uncharacterized protein n=1 Tax=marine sediment metagenome TaxID=412755 RepID=A0A0F8VUZ3_9ZZZZ